MQIKKKWNRLDLKDNMMALNVPINEQTGITAFYANPKLVWIGRNPSTSVFINILTVLHPGTWFQHAEKQHNKIFLSELLFHQSIFVFAASFI